MPEPPMEEPAAEPTPTPALPTQAPVHFHGYTLDPFQVEAFNAIHKSHSVVVSAPTGSGKTLIADYIIDRDLKAGKRVIYTAPIKALSNQKFSDFKKEYGENFIGIMTGDVVINAKAQILVMTTEVYRNMALVNDPVLADVQYVIFDEIHYINDIERGYIWEESIIFSPEHIRFLCLSATIPNSKEFAEWIHTVKHHQVDVVLHHQRSVPLIHYFYDQELGITTLSAIRKKAEEDRMPRYEDLYRNKKGGRGPRPQIPLPNFVDLLRVIARRGEIPCIYFVFSRSGTQTKASLMAKKIDLLNPQQKAEMISFTNQELGKAEPQIRQMRTTRILRDLLARGIAFHHAGMLPQLKAMVEAMFAKGWIKILFATETFAVGVNYPAKAVVFDSLEKYDGHGFRYLNSKEYFQIGGRAGRRGIDKHGTVISMIHRATADFARIEKFTAKDEDPIISQFKMSYNTVLNMVRGHNEAEIEVILRSNFGQFQKYGAEAVRTGSKGSIAKAGFTKKKHELEKLGYVSVDKLTPKGEFACYIFANELTVTEAFFGDFVNSLSLFEMVMLIATIMYEPRKSIKFIRYQANPEVENLLKKINNHPLLRLKIDPKRVRMLSVVVKPWYDGDQFMNVLRNSNLLEGDLIRLFRQVIDMLTQIKKATHDFELVKRLDECVGKIEREFVLVEF